MTLYGCYQMCELDTLNMYKYIENVVSRRFSKTHIEFYRIYFEQTSTPSWFVDLTLSSVRRHRRENDAHLKILTHFSIWHCKRQLAQMAGWIIQHLLSSRPAAAGVSAVYDIMDIKYHIPKGSAGLKQDTLTITAMHGQSSFKSEDSFPASPWQRLRYIQQVS